MNRQSERVSEMTLMGALQFGFTKLVVNDLDRIEAFYREVFGMRVLHRVENDEHRFALVESIMELDDQSHKLVITQYLGKECPPSGAAWTGFVVSDLDATLDQVVSLGGTVEVPPHDNEDHGVRAAIATDPEGHLMELIQRIANSYS